MNGTIAHLQVNLRGLRGSAAQTARGISESGARTALTQACNTELDAVMRDDPRVIIMRSFHARCGVAARDLADVATLSSAVGTQLARAVLEIVRAGPVAEACTIYADEAAYLASFIGDLAAGLAWSQWRYWPLAHLRELSREQAIEHLLLEDIGSTPARPELAAVLACLQRDGSLAQVLDTLSPAALKSLAERCCVGTDEISVAVYQPLIAAAIDIARAIGYACEPGATTNLLIRICQHGQIAPPDWRDPGALASCVFELISTLAVHASLRANIRNVDMIHAALAGYEWLDSDNLGARLALLTAPSAAGATAQHSLHRPRYELALRLARQLMADGTVIVCGDPGARAAAAISLYAALAARDASFGGDPLTAHAVQAVLRERWQDVQTDDMRPGSQVTAPFDAAEYVDTATAGVFLLLRAVLDLRLHTRVSQAALPGLLTELASRWSGISDADDFGIQCFAGDAASPRVLPDMSQLQAGVFESLQTQRLTDIDALRVHQVEWRGASALLCGDSARGYWPLSATPASPEQMRETLAAWRAHGIRLDDTLASAAVPATLLVLRSDTACTPPDDLALCGLANSALRVWARWLRAFSQSSASYLLHEFVRRPGRILRAGDRLHVQLEARPLDLVLRQAGYLDAIERVPWLGGRTIIFEVAP